MHFTDLLSLNKIPLFVLTSHIVTDSFCPPPLPPHDAAGEPGYSGVLWRRSDEGCEEQGGSLQASHPDQGYLLQTTHAEQTITDR